MSLFDIIAIILTLAAVFGYLNSRFLKLEPSVGLLMITLVSSLGVMLLSWLLPDLEQVAVIRACVVVLFSILVQGLTIKKVLRRYIWGPARTTGQPSNSSRTLRVSSAAVNGFWRNGVPGSSTP